jgi:hypothetical protein
VHLRRALLLFVIVLGLAALAASVSRQGDNGSERTAPPASPQPDGRQPEATARAPATPSPSPVEVTFEASRKRTRRVAVGQAATIVIEVDEPGQVEIPDLGLTEVADPLTPARFEVLVSEATRYEISFTPADDDEAADAGTLVVAPSER